MQNSIRAVVLLAIITASITGGCTSTEFAPYEAKVTDFEGQGGTKTRSNDIDFWENGDPPRKFRVLGIIDDKRSDGLIPMSGKKGDIANKARSVGGDAVILLNDRSVVTGLHSTASGTSYSTDNLMTTTAASSTGVRRSNSSKWAVVKYLEN